MRKNLKLILDVYSISDFDKDNIIDNIENKIAYLGYDPKISYIKYLDDITKHKVNAFVSETKVSLERKIKALQYGKIEIGISYVPY